MKRVIFELSMPNRASWNGGWSGEKNKYTISKIVTEESFKNLKEYYSYNFKDGWTAAVTVRLAKPREKASGKFSGYDWMIDSILYNGEIATEKRAA